MAENVYRHKLAAVCTLYRKYSHSQHIVDRFLEGYDWGGTHHHPAMDLVSLYVDQLPKGDLTPDRAARVPVMKVYPTIAEALTRGTDKLAVDGVVLVGERGDDPRNEKRPTMYPQLPYSVSNGGRLRLTLSGNPEAEPFVERRPDQNLVLIGASI